jgi:hypothetical protein
VLHHISRFASRRQVMVLPLCNRVQWQIEKMTGAKRVTRVTSRVASWKVSLRGMMIMIALLAIWLGWKVNKASNQRETVAIIKKHVARVAYDWSGPATKGPSGRTPPGPVWLRKWLGDEYFQEIIYVNMAYSDPELSDVLSLEGTPRVINGPGIACLRSLPALDTLMLMSSQITDDGMEELATLPNLRVLYVRRSSVSPEARARLLSSRPQLGIFP